jgi:excisionase family DNA binding protein
MSATSLPAKRKRGRPPGSRNRPAPALSSSMVLAMRVPEAAAAVRVSVSYMKQMIAKGTVKSVLIGRMRLIPVSSLRELIGEGE